MSSYKVQNRELNTEKVKEEDNLVGDTEYARIFHNLGNVYLQNGHLDVALQCYEEALTIRRKVLNIGATDDSILTQLCDSNVNRVANHEKLRDMADTLQNLGWLHEIQIFQFNRRCGRDF